MPVSCVSYLFSFHFFILALKLPLVYVCNNINIRTGKKLDSLPWAYFIHNIQTLHDHFCIKHLIIFICEADALLSVSNVLYIHKCKAIFYFPRHM